MSEQGGGEALDWGVLVPRLVHPTKVLIVESMHWIGEPLSSSELVKIFDKRFSIANVSYHVGKLAEVGVLMPIRKEQVRGAWKTRYVFAKL